MKKCKKIKIDENNIEAIIDFSLIDDNTFYVALLNAILESKKTTNNKN